MAYTRHGHQIIGTTVLFSRPAQVMRCGGPKLCKECALDQARVTGESVKAAPSISAYAHDLALQNVLSSAARKYPDEPRLQMFMVIGGLLALGWTPPEGIDKSEQRE